MRFWLAREGCFASTSPLTMDNPVAMRLFIRS